MREIVIDTETTGLDAANDRIVEVGCVELFNHIPTGQTAASSTSTPAAGCRATRRASTG